MGIQRYSFGTKHRITRERSPEGEYVLFSEVSKRIREAAQGVRDRFEITIGYEEAPAVEAIHRLILGQME